MHPHAGHAGRRCNCLLRPPIAFGNVDQLVMAERGLGMHDRAELMVLNRVSQRQHGGLEAAFMADAKLDARCLAGLDRSPGTSSRQPKRLFTKDMCSRMSTEDHLFLM